MGDPAGQRQHRMLTQEEKQGVHEKEIWIGMLSSIYGVDLVKIEPDGNCLFWALARGIKRKGWADMKPEQQKKFMNKIRKESVTKILSDENYSDDVYHDLRSNWLPMYKKKIKDYWNKQPSWRGNAQEMMRIVNKENHLIDKEDIRTLYKDAWGPDNECTRDRPEWGDSLHLNAIATKYKLSVHVDVVYNRGPNECGLETRNFPQLHTNGQYITTGLGGIPDSKFDMTRATSIMLVLVDGNHYEMFDLTQVEIHNNQLMDMKDKHNFYTWLHFHTDKDLAELCMRIESVQLGRLRNWIQSLVEDAFMKVVNMSNIEQKKRVEYQENMNEKVAEKFVDHLFDDKLLRDGLHYHDDGDTVAWETIVRKVILETTEQEDEIKHEINHLIRELGLSGDDLFESDVYDNSDGWSNPEPDQSEFERVKHWENSGPEHGHDPDPEHGYDSYHEDDNNGPNIYDPQLDYQDDRYDAAYKKGMEMLDGEIKNYHNDVQRWLKDQTQYWHTKLKTKITQADNDFNPSNEKFKKQATSLNRSELKLNLEHATQELMQIAHNLFDNEDFEEHVSWQIPPNLQQRRGNHGNANRNNNFQQRGGRQRGGRGRFQRQQRSGNHGNANRNNNFQQRGGRQRGGRGGFQRGKGKRGTQYQQLEIPFVTGRRSKADQRAAAEAAKGGQNTPTTLQNGNYNWWFPFKKKDKGNKQQKRFYKEFWNVLHMGVRFWICRRSVAVYEYARKIMAIHDKKWVNVEFAVEEEKRLTYAKIFESAGLHDFSTSDFGHSLWNDVQKIENGQHVFCKRFIRNKTSCRDKDVQIRMAAYLQLLFKVRHLKKKYKDTFDHGHEITIYAAKPGADYIVDPTIPPSVISSTRTGSRRWLVV